MAIKTSIECKLMVQICNSQNITIFTKDCITSKVFNCLENLTHSGNRRRLVVYTKKLIMWVSALAMNEFGIFVSLELQQIPDQIQNPWTISDSEKKRN